MQIIHAWHLYQATANKQRNGISIKLLRINKHHGIYIRAMQINHRWHLYQAMQIPHAWQLYHLQSPSDTTTPSISIAYRANAIQPTLGISIVARAPSDTTTHGISNTFQSTAYHYITEPRHISYITSHGISIILQSMAYRLYYRARHITTLQSHGI